MAENLQPARCTEAEFKAAQEAGLLVVTTAEELAIHKFAETIRAEMINAAQPAAPSGWLIEQGVSEFDDTPYFSIRDLKSQLGQDFYADRDTLIFCFLSAFSLTSAGDLAVNSGPAPIARLKVSGDSVTATLYSPGLPDGEFDVWLEPANVDAIQTAAYAEGRNDAVERAAEVCRSLWRIDGQATADEFAAEVEADSRSQDAE